VRVGASGKFLSFTTFCVKTTLLSLALSMPQLRHHEDKGGEKTKEKNRIRTRSHFFPIRIPVPAEFLFLH